MQLTGIVPDQHTTVAVLKATSKLGDVETAYDALQDMKLHGLPMTEHVYNGLIRTYAGACRINLVREKHIDVYMEDSWALYEQIKESPDLEVNAHILNSMVLLHANAFRIDELDQKVLPLNLVTATSLREVSSPVKGECMYKSCPLQARPSSRAPSSHLSPASYLRLRPLCPLQTV